MKSVGYGRNMHERGMKGETAGSKALAAENASAIRGACGVMG